jgi:hypothetical protein
MTDVKKSRTILAEELPEYRGDKYDASIYFSQDEEYLIIGSSNTKKLINDIFIIRIGSLSEFFSGSPIDVKAVLQLNNLNIKTKIIGVHMSR